MRVAITIPTHNRSTYLQEAIASVQAQTLQDWRLVVVDDGSTDGTRAVVERLAVGDRRIRLLVQDHAGGAAARNRGMSEEREADFAAFLDDDDVWEPRTLEMLVAELESDSAAVAAYGLARTVDSGGRPLRPGVLEAHGLNRTGVSGLGLTLWPERAPTTFAVLAVSNVITTPGQVLIRRSALMRAHKFREPAPDWQMWLDLSRQGPFLLVPHVVVGWRWHEGNITRNEFRMSVSRLRVHWGLLWSPGLAMNHRGIAWVGFVRYYVDMPRIRRRGLRLWNRLTRGLRAEPTVD